MPLVQVKLLGVLGKKFGRSHSLFVNTPAEAIRLLHANSEEFGNFLIASENQGIGYRCVIDSPEGIEAAELHFGIGRSQQLIIAPVATGSGAVGKILLGTALLVGSFFMPATIGLFGATISSFTVGAIGASLILGGLASFFQPNPANNSKKNESSDSKLIGGLAAPATQGLCVPVAYGERYTEDLPLISVNLTTADIDDDDDILESTDTLRLLYALCEGPIEGGALGSASDSVQVKLEKSVFLDGVPVRNDNGDRNFDDKEVKVQWRSGTQNQAPIDGFDDVFNTESPTNLANGFAAANDSVTHLISNLDCDYATIRLSFRNGLQKINEKNGETEGYDVQFKVELQGGNGVQPTGTFLTVASNKTIKGKAPGTYVAQYRINLKNVGGVSLQGPWNLRVTRLSDAVDPNDANLKRNTFWWESITTVVNTRFRYPNTAILALTLSADRFSSAPRVGVNFKFQKVLIPSNYNPTARSYSGNWDGTFILAYTNNPAWCFYSMLLNKRFGLGDRLLDRNATDETSSPYVDKAGLYSIAQYCDGLVDDGSGGTEPRFTISAYISNRQNAYDLLNQLSSIFRGACYYNGGQIFAIQDRPPIDPLEPAVRQYTESDVIQSVSDQGIVTKPCFTYRGVGLEAIHTIAFVSYTDKTDLYKDKIEPIEWRDGINRYGWRPLELNPIGVSSQSQARRVGRYAVITEWFETEVITFRVGSEGMLVLPGQVFKILDPYRYRKSWGGRIKTASTTQVTLDRSVTLDPGISYTLTVKKRDGSGVNKRSVNNAPGAYSLLSCTEFPEEPLSESTWVLETTTKKAELWKCLTVTEDEGDTSTEYEITASRYEPNKYDLADSIEPLDEDAIRLLASQAPGAVQGLNVELKVAIVGRLTPT